MSEFIQSDECWELRPNPGRVAYASSTPRPELVFVSDEEEWSVSLGSEVQVTSSGEEETERRPVFEDFGRSSVKSIRAFDNGRLELESIDGLLAAIEPALEYEAWEIRRNNETVMLALPLGGGLGRL